MTEKLPQASCTLKIGDKVQVKKNGELGVITCRCNRKEWDWYVTHRLGGLIPYREDELQPIPEGPSDIALLGKLIC